jgi:hypothetical protein
MAIFHSYDKLAEDMQICRGYASAVKSLGFKKDRAYTFQGSKAENLPLLAEYLCFRSRDFRRILSQKMNYPLVN